MEVAVTIPNHQTPAKPESQAGCLSILIRLTWIFGGIGVLLFTAVYIAMRKAPGLADIIFLLAAIGIVIVRFVDIRYFKGETLDNQPATLKHWRRFSIMILIVAGLLYSLAKIVAHLKLL
jgi:hypothetical protein